MGFFVELFGNNSERELREQLEKDLEQLREEIVKIRDEKNVIINGLEKKLELQQDEVAYYQSEIEKSKIEKAELRKNLDEMEMQLKEYKESYDAVSKVLVKAQKDADCRIDEAEKKAERITNQAKMETFLFQKKAEAEIQKKYDTNQKRFACAKDKIEETMNTVNETRERLVAAYMDLGDLIKKMPMQMEWLYPEEVSEFALDEENSSKEKLTEENDIGVKNPVSMQDVVNQ